MALSILFYIIYDSGLTSNFFACEDDCLITAGEGQVLPGSMARLVIATAGALGGYRTAVKLLERVDFVLTDICFLIERLRRSLSSSFLYNQMNIRHNDFYFIMKLKYS